METMEATLDRIHNVVDNLIAGLERKWNDTVTELAKSEAKGEALKVQWAERDTGFWTWLRCALRHHPQSPRRVFHSGSVGGVRAVASWTRCTCGRHQSQTTVKRALPLYPEKP